MRHVGFMERTLLALSLVLGGCKITVPVAVADPNEADATLVLQYDHGFEDYKLDWEEAEDKAIDLCRLWGYGAVEYSEEGSVECIGWHDSTVEGARPHGQSESPGLGTSAAERERDSRNIGTVGQSVRTASSPPGAEYGCIRWRVTYQARCVR